MKRNALLLIFGIGVALLVAGVAREPADPSTASYSPLSPVARTATGATDSPPSLRVAGLMVNSPIGDPGAQFEELAFMGTFAGTRMAIELVFPTGGLIDLKRESCQLDVFTDDRGTDLLNANDAFGPFEMLPRVSDSTRSVVFVIASDSLPAVGTSALRAKGVVSVVVAHGNVQHEAKGVALTPGMSFEIGPWSFEVTASTESDWNEGHWATTLETATDPASIVSYSLFDASGTEFEWSPTMSMSGGSTWSQTLEAERSLKDVTIRIEAWDDPQVIEVPFDLRASLALK